MAGDGSHCAGYDRRGDPQHQFQRGGARVDEAFPYTGGIFVLPTVPGDAGRVGNDRVDGEILARCTTGGGVQFNPVSIQGLT